MLLTASLVPDPSGYQINFVAQNVPPNTAVPLYVEMVRPDGQTFVGDYLSQATNAGTLDAFRPGISWSAQLYDNNFDPIGNPVTVSTLRFGDADGDGDVDQSDVNIAQANAPGGPGKTWEQGDFNNDGYVNNDDLAIVNAASGADAATVDLDLPASIVQSAPLHPNLSYEHDVDRADYWEIDFDDGTEAVALDEDLASVLAHTYESTGTYTMSATAYGPDGAKVATAEISVTAAPAVFHDEYGPHKLEWLFGDDYSATLDASDLWLMNLTTGDVFEASLTMGPGNHATFTFPDATSNGRAGVLPDGNYQAIINAGGVDGLSADEVFSFFVLAVDVNHDRVVDEADIAIMQANFTGALSLGYPPSNPVKSFRQGDVDYDGDVDTNDYGMWGPRYGNRMLVPPPTPVELTVIPSTNRSRFIEWAESDWVVNGQSHHVDGYYLYVSVNDGPFDVFGSLPFIGHTETSAFEVNVPDGSKSQFYVRAYSDAGQSVVSATETVMTPLPAPENVTVDSVGDTTLRLRFTDKSRGENGFDVELTSSSGTVVYPFPARAGEGGYTVTITGLSPSTAYDYRVRAVTSIVTSDWTPSGTVMTLSAGTPAAPTNLRSTSLVNAYVRLAWADNSNNEVRFEVERSTDGGASYSWFRDVAGGSGSTKETTIDWPDQRESAYFRVVAVGSSGQRSISNAVAVAPGRGGHIEVTATADTTPADEKIILNWRPLLTASTFKVYRASTPSDGWGSPIATVTDATTFIDDDIQAGETFHYRVEAVGTFEPYGYVTAAVAAPESTYRGKVVLAIALESNQKTILASRIARLKQDLVGDGWEVITIDNINASSSVESVRTAILNHVWVDQERDFEVKQVLLLGHVPIPFAGWVHPDGHVNRPMPADQYYADINGTWTDAIHYGSGNTIGDGVFDHADYGDDRAPELGIGRVDMSGLVAFAETEAELLARYLDRDHTYRQGITSLARSNQRAFIIDYVNHGGTWHNFAGLVDPDAIDSGDWTVLYDEEQASQWAYIGGGGWTNAVIMNNTAQRPMLHVDIDPNFGALPEHDLSDADNHYQGIFNVMFGSYFVDWSYNNALLRSLLANNGRALTAVWGHHSFNFSTMASGGTMGEAGWTSQAHEAFWGTLGATYVSLLGDPTLRQHVVQPVADVLATPTSSGVTLTWTASPDATDGYRVFAALADGTTPFEELEFTEIGSGTSNLTLTDTTATAAGTYVYMVRARKLEDGPGGSYFNLSQGTFAIAVIGSSGNDSYTLTSDPSDGVVSVAGIAVSPSKLSSISIDGKGGDDIVDLEGDASATELLNLNVGGGSGSTQNSLNVVSADVILHSTQHFSSISIASDKATVAEGADKVLVTDALSITGGTLDLKDNSMIVTDADVADIRALIFSGYGSGGWNGTTGIKGTGTPPAGKTMALGYAQGDDSAISVLGGYLNGEAFGSDAVVIRFTYQGDADLDGDVDGVDMGYFSANFTGSGGSTTKLWTEADWDYDGDVDGVDSGFWSANYTGSGG